MLRIADACSSSSGETESDIDKEKHDISNSMKDNSNASFKEIMNNKIEMTHNSKGGEVSQNNIQILRLKL